MYGEGTQGVCDVFNILQNFLKTNFCKFRHEEDGKAVFEKTTGLS